MLLLISTSESEILVIFVRGGFIVLIIILGIWSSYVSRLISEKTMVREERCGCLMLQADVISFILIFQAVHRGIKLAKHP